MEFLEDYVEAFFWEIFLLGAFCSLLGGLLAWRKIHSLKCQKNLYKAVGAGTPWAVWDLGDGFQGCSTSFRHLLGVALTGKVSLREVITSFEEAEDLERSLSALRFSEESFYRDVILQRTRRSVCLHGFYVAASPRDLVCLRLCDDAQEVLQPTTAPSQGAEHRADWRELLEAFPFPIWRRRSGDLRLDYCNKAYAEAVGSNLERVLLENTPILSKGNADGGKTFASLALEQKQIQVSSQTRVIQGKRCHLLIHETPFNEGTLGFALDDTEHYDAERQLKRHVDAHTEVFGFLSTSIAIFNQNMRLTYFNEAYTRLMGLNEKWLHAAPSFGEVLEALRLKRKLPEVVDFRSYKKEQLALFQTVVEVQRELMHLPNAHTLHVSVAPYPLGGLLFLYEDVTDSITLERRYNTLISVQRETINRLHEGISVFSSDNRLRLSNVACCEIWGIAPESTTPGQHISSFLENIKPRVDYMNDWESFKEHIISNLTDRVPKEGQLLLTDNTTIDFTYTPLSDGTHLHTFIPSGTAPHRKKMLLKQQNHSNPSEEQSASP
ncbi:MAG: PAS-domain containing protein [Holosporales bacterium]|jgi:PAS domain-containing protein|nr:PAS-domain containing protein [Holosporales bacterium]